MSFINNKKSLFDFVHKFSPTFSSVVKNEKIGYLKSYILNRNFIQYTNILFWLFNNNVERFTLGKNDQ